MKYIKFLSIHIYLCSSQHLFYGLTRTLIYICLSLSLSISLYSYFSQSLSHSLFLIAQLKLRFLALPLSLFSPTHLHSACLSQAQLEYFSRSSRAECNVFPNWSVEWPHRVRAKPTRCFRMVVNPLCTAAHNFSCCSTLSAHRWPPHSFIHLFIH